MADPSSAFEHPAEQIDILCESIIYRDQLVDLANGVHDGRVIPSSEFSADLWQ